MTDNKLTVNFQDNSLLPAVYGVHDKNLRAIEQALGVRIHNRGNVITLKGDNEPMLRAQAILGTLYNSAKQGEDISENTIASLVDLQTLPPAAGDSLSAPPRSPRSPHPDLAKIGVGNKSVAIRGAAQAAYLENMQNASVCFAIGPAGTGKTHLAVCYGASLLLSGQVERMIITRPAVEAGERLGFLPGDINEKFDPYLRPIYDALGAVLKESQIAKLRADGAIEIAPLAYMRGRTLSHAFIMLDEAQNTTSLQMKMFLTRLGEGSRMVITGDPSQIDLPNNEMSGLRQAREILKDIDGIAFSEFQSTDIVRHPLIDKIVQAYDGLYAKG